MDIFIFILPKRFILRCFDRLCCEAFGDLYNGKTMDNVTCAEARELFINAK